MLETEMDNKLMLLIYFIMSYRLIKAIVYVCQVNERV